MVIAEDDLCPECLGSGRNPLDKDSRCPLCGGDGKMSIERAMDAWLEQFETDDLLGLYPGEQN